MKLSCSAYQAGSSYTQKILSGHMQNYGATSSTTKAIQGESTAGLLMPSWKVRASYIHNDSLIPFHSIARVVVFFLQLDNT